MNNKGNIMENSKIICFDIETTGLDPKINDILSLTIAEANSVEDMVNEKYTLYKYAVFPTTEMENSKGKADLIKRLYGDKYSSWTDIYNECIKQGYTSISNKLELAEILSKHFQNPYGKILPIIGQYVRFDLSFIDELYNNTGKRMYNRVEIDTRELFYQWKLKSMPLSDINSGGNLEKIIEELGIPYIEDGAWHFSDYDVKMTIKAFSKLWKLLDNSFIINK